MKKRLPIVMLTILILLLPILTGAASSRSYVSNSHTLTLDGVQTGFVKSVQGGKVYAEVINEPIGSDKVVHKHVGQPKYENYVMQVGFSMAKPVYEWIAATWTGNYQRKNGSVSTLDANLNAKSQRDFYNALLTETTIPAMDGTSKEPAYMTVKFAPEYTRSAKVADNKSSSTATAAKGEQKTWIPSNFRLEIDGLDATKVNKIDAFTVKQTAVQNSVGDARDQQREPGKLEFPNLKITLSAVGADSWAAWFEDFVIKGNNIQDKEKNGTLYLLATDRQTVLAKIKFYNMGIVSIGELDSESGSDLQAELYVERMEFEVPQSK